MANPAETRAMLRAIELSTRAQGSTPPNPDVGCVILDSDGNVAGEGWFDRPGGPHAEVVAIRNAGERARGGTAVVTLEPCDHYGRTPPCTSALIDAGIARVVYAVADPNPVAAGGADTLRRHAIEVESGLLAEEAALANARWLTPFRKHRPFVVWKYAATLDGRIAASDGTSQWITCADARADVHRLRSVVDTIIVGVGTVLTDDPRLTVRLDEFPDPPEMPGAVPNELMPPLRVVVDSHERTPANARVRDASAPTWIATSDEVGAGPNGQVDLAKLLAQLYEDGRRYALLEGGSSLAGAFWRAGLIDRVVAYVAPSLLGAGAAALGDAGVTTIDDAIGLEISDVSRVGPDVRITATPKGSGDLVVESGATSRPDRFEPAEKYEGSA